MPTKKVDQPAGDEVIARGAEDVALKLGGGPTRDALLDPRDTDYIPDNEEKGYHVGTVRQPAEPVLRASGAVDFESTEAPGPSKFETAADQKARSNAREAGNPAYEGVPFTPISIPRSQVTGVAGGEARLKARGIEVTDDSDESKD